MTDEQANILLAILFPLVLWAYFDLGGRVMQESMAFESMRYIYQECKK